MCFFQVMLLRVGARASARDSGVERVLGCCLASEKWL